MDDVQQYWAKGQVEELRKRLADAPPQHVAYLRDDVTYQRFLVANKGGLKKAEKQLRATLHWRDDFKVSEIGVDAVRDQLATGKSFVHGHDKFGRPTMWTKRRLDGPSDPLEKAHMWVYNMEKGLRFMKYTGAKQIVWVVDLEGYDRKKNSQKGGLSHTISLIKVFMNHYCECLGTMIIVEAPGISGFLWRIFSAFIDARTKAKVEFSKGTPEQRWQVFSKYFDREDVPPAYGGTSEFAYSVDECEGSENEAREFAAAAARFNRGDAVVPPAPSTGVAAFEAAAATASAAAGNEEETLSPAEQQAILAEVRGVSNDHNVAATVSDATHDEPVHHNEPAHHDIDAEHSHGAVEHHVDDDTLHEHAMESSGF